jgi:hypothetical protein
MNDQEIIAKFFEVRPEFAVQANISFLRDQAAKPLTVESLSAAADQLRDTLLLAPEYESAFEAFLFHNGKKKNLAERAIFIETMRAKEIQAAASQEYEALIKQLGEKWRGNTIERLREVVEKRRIHNMTASQFKEQRAPTPKEHRPYAEFPTLPEILVLPGNVQATRIDAAFLTNLPKTDFYLYRRLYNKFGGQQITDRQNGIVKGAAQPQGE